jgi:O-antigen ligase
MVGFPSQTATGWGRPTTRPAYLSTRRAETLLIGAFGLSCFGLLLNNTAVLVGDISAIAIASSVALGRGRKSSYAAPLAVCLYVVVLLYVLASFSSNFPGWYPALLGLRKMVPPWIFLLAGAVWPGDVTRLMRRVLLLLLGACSASLALHNAAPGVEGAIVRRASEYTALYAGAPRLQGVFAGPFHAALAGLTLVIASAALPRLWASRSLRVAAGAVGVAVLVQASVRSGWVAVMAGLLVVFAFGPNGRRVSRAQRIGGLAGGLLFAVLGNLQALAFQNNAALESLTHWRTDNRFLNRIETYREALGLVGKRPLLGWGPGSAADTLDNFFQNGVHVTAHNMFLAYAVEVGIPGAVAIFAMIILGMAALTRGVGKAEASTFGLGLLVAFVLFGASGTAVDAAPVSALVLLLVGLAAASTIGEHDRVPGGVEHLGGGRAPVWASR